MKNLLGIITGLFLMASCSGNASSEKEREDSIPKVDSLAQMEAVRQAEEVSKAAEQARLDSIRQDSIKIIDKFHESLLKPSDVFLKNHSEDNSVKESKEIIKVLDSKGYKLLTKKLNFPVETDWGGDMTASYWKYRLEIENPYSNKKYNCEVYIGEVYGNDLEITFNSEKEAIDFINRSSPYIQNKSGNTYDLNDYQGMERKGKKIIVYKTAE